MLKLALFSVLLPSVGYFLFLGLLTIPIFQNQVVYMNRVTLTWFQDINIPEQWGFMRGQVTPFKLHTSDGESLHAWHILPLNLYRKFQPQLVGEPFGLASDVRARLGFQLLHDDPESLLVLYFHGAAGTLASGWRPPSYRALYAGDPDKIHIVAIDYRGFGSSTGVPSEEGLLTDAITLAEWATKEAGIPPERIVLFGQSLGTAVCVSLALHLATRPTPILFSGMVLVAPFASVELLTATYRVAGVVPILGPVTPFPRLLALLNTFIESKWPSKEKLAAFIRQCHSMTGPSLGYHVDIIHAEDDYDVPWTHSDAMFWHAVNASTAAGISHEDLAREKLNARTELGAGGWVATRQTEAGLIREEIAKCGLHDRIMSYPVVSLAIMRAFRRK